MSQSLASAFFNTSAVSTRKCLTLYPLRSNIAKSSSASKSESSIINTRNPLGISQFLQNTPAPSSGVEMNFRWKFLQLLARGDITPFFVRRSLDAYAMLAACDLPALAAPDIH